MQKVISRYNSIIMIDFALYCHVQHCEKLLASGADPGFSGEGGRGAQKIIRDTRTSRARRPRKLSGFMLSRAIMSLI